MNFKIFGLIAAAAFAFALSTRMVITPINNVQVISINKKAFTGCSPSYIPSADEEIPRLTGWGNYRWKVSTNSDSAQFYFDQGINMYYAFHIIESRASFDKAIRFDPSFAMGWWGKSLAFGPNINDFGYARPSEAWPSAMKALELSANCTDLEKALIKAISVRYSEDSTKDQQVLNETYRSEMQTVYQHFASNADAVTLYADALMLLHPWDLYNHDYTPKPWTPELIKVLRQSMKLKPKHPGANHFYIHAIESSSNPAEAMKSAEILSSAMPEVSHMIHMPSHIYIRTGQYEKGIDRNLQSIKGYSNYKKYFAPVEENVFLYVLHNLHMKLSCGQMAGNYAIAIKASGDLKKQIPAEYLQMGGSLGNYLQYMDASELFTKIRFGKWDEILSGNLNSALPYTKVLNHFARGMAYLGKNNIKDAKAELLLLKDGMRDTVLREFIFPFNKASDGGLVAQYILEGMIHSAMNENEQAIIQLQLAVNAEDRLQYQEPRDWLLPARHYLGKVLLNTGKFAEAKKVFLKDLEINPENGWALSGLVKAFEGLKNKKNAALATKRMKNSWKIKDIEINSPVF